MIKRSREVSDKNAAGIEFLFKKNKVDYLRGEALLDKPGEVLVKLNDGKTRDAHARQDSHRHRRGFARAARHCHSMARRVIGSREAMILEPQPKSMVIIGAGAIGVEFAYFYNAFGTKVTLIEMMPHILPVEDSEVSQSSGKSPNETRNQNAHRDQRPTKAETTKTGCSLTLEGKAAEKRSRRKLHWSRLAWRRCCPRES